MSAASAALIVQTVETESSQNRGANEVGRFENLRTNHSRRNESTHEFEISIRHAVRVVRTIHVGLSSTAKASTPLTDTSTTKSKKSSFQIAGFVVNHPILAMLVLGLIALIGFGCIFLYCRSGGCPSQNESQQFSAQGLHRDNGIAAICDEWNAEVRCRNCVHAEKPWQRNKHGYRGNPKRAANWSPGINGRSNQLMRPTVG